MGQEIHGHTFERSLEMRAAIGWWLITLSGIIAFMMIYYTTGYFDLKEAIYMGVAASLATAIFIVRIYFLLGDLEDGD